MGRSSQNGGKASSFVFGKGGKARTGGMLGQDTYGGLGISIE